VLQIAIDSINNNRLAAEKGKNSKKGKKEKDEHFFDTLKQHLTEKPMPISKKSRMPGKKRVNGTGHGTNNISGSPALQVIADFQGISGIKVKNKSAKGKNSLANARITAKDNLRDKASPKKDLNPKGVSAESKGKNYYEFSNKDSPAVTAAKAAWGEKANINININHAHINRSIKQEGTSPGKSTGTTNHPQDKAARERVPIKGNQDTMINQAPGQEKNNPGSAAEKKALVKTEALDEKTRQTIQIKGNHTNNISSIKEGKKGLIGTEENHSKNPGSIKEKGKSLLFAAENTADFTGDKNIPGKKESPTGLRGLNKENSERFQKIQQNTFDLASGIKNGIDEKPASISPDRTLVKSQINQITEQVMMTIKKGLPGNRPSSLEISLKPEHLGKVKIQLQATDGMVSIRVMADTGEAVNLLNSNIQTIRDNIEQQGIRLQYLGVGLESDQEQGSYSDSSDSRGNNQKNLSLGLNPDGQYGEINEQPDLLLSPGLNLLA